MKKYFSLQCKKILKIFPSVLCVTLILAIVVVTALTLLLHSLNSSEDGSIIKVGVTGDLNNKYLKWGLAMVQAIDDTRFTIQFIEMSEEEAIKGINSGYLTSYIVLPPDFVDNAIAGKLEPLKYVSSPSAGSLGAILESQITETVSDMVINAEKGTYGLYNAVTDHISYSAGYEHQYNISLKYVELILSRGDIYNIQEMGISDGLNLPEYYVCGIAVLFLMLAGLPFVASFIKKDNALNDLLMSKGLPHYKQILCEWGALFLALLTLTLVIGLLGFIIYLFIPDLVISASLIIKFMLCTIPVLALVSAFDMMVFEISKNIVSGVLLKFFLSLGLCYISGCFYPIYAFPVIIQKLEMFMPTGAARGILASAFDSSQFITSFLATIIFIIAFYGITLFSRTRKVYVSRRDER